MFKFSIMTVRFLHNSPHVTPLHPRGRDHSGPVGGHGHHRLLGPDHPPALCNRRTTTRLLVGENGGGAVALRHDRQWQQRQPWHHGRAPGRPGAGIHLIEPAHVRLQQDRCARASPEEPGGPSEGCWKEERQLAGKHWTTVPVKSHYQFLFVHVRKLWWARKRIFNQDLVSRLSSTLLTKSLRIRDYHVSVLCFGLYHLQHKS